MVRNNATTTHTVMRGILVLTTAMLDILKNLNKSIFSQIYKINRLSGYI